MKKLLLPLICLFAIACSKKQTRTYSISRPVYASKAEVLASLKAGMAKPVKSPGKIFIQGKYLFINEINKGIHVIDNSDPRNPENVSFINIPGNVDLAVKGNILYADMSSYMVIIDITDPLQSKIIRSIPDVFEWRNYGGNGDSSQLLIDLITKDTTVDVESSVGWWGCANCSAAEAFASLNSGGSKSSAPGVGGSMARFTIVNDYLYTVGDWDLNSFDITEEDNPEHKARTSIGGGIETIYPFKNNLFIGSSTGMFIYNINNPAEPQLRGIFNHASACDPVIADNAYAFVTLRTGTTCQGFNNQLDIVDIGSLSNPKLVKSYSLSNPHGLAKDKNTLFICDGKSGLKVYNASYVKDLRLIKQIKNIEAYDAIAWNNKLIVSAKDGIYQYDYSDLSNITLLSKIKKETINN